jgi:hypothetical protein
METPTGPSIDDDDWQKRCLEADIATFRNMVEDAPVEEVDVPDGRKNVTVAWQDSNGFHEREGRAIGVYRDYDEQPDPLSDEPQWSRIHIDWESPEGERTTIEREQLVTLDESDYYHPDTE